MNMSLLSLGSGQLSAISHLGATPEQHVDDAAKSNLPTAQSLLVRTTRQQESLAVQFQDAASRVIVHNDGGEAVGDIQSRQLNFEFFFESRQEELVLFQSRTDAAAEGLPARQAGLVRKTSERLAVRFSMSASISGEALAGFTDAVDEARREKMLAFLDRFMRVAQKLLEGPDAWINEFFSVFSGDVTGQKYQHLEEMMNEFLKSFFGVDKNNAAMRMNSGQQAGTAQAFQMQRMGMQLEFSFSLSIEAEFSEEMVLQADPLVFDLTGDGFNLTSHTDGAQFDLLGTGAPVRTAFVTGGDAFLAIELNGDGVVNNGKELFGDQNGAANGFEELRKYDANGDGVINHHDSHFDQFVLWRDNGNGITEPGELLSLRDLGIVQINLNYREVDKQVAGGNRITEIATFKYGDGRLGKVADVQLNYLA